MKTIKVPAGSLHTGTAQLFSLLLLFLFSTSGNGQYKTSHRISESGNSSVDLLKITKRGTGPFNYVHCGLQDKAENSWFGTYGRTDNPFEGDGVYRYDGKIITHSTTKEGLCSNSIRGITKDKTGEIKYKSK
ncbi:hypothetical protein [Runella sp.]|uniref:hypothetical protein n=1 Tax=Runella sp. TaxID=1960881 RepID=UPI003D0F9126